MTHLNANTVGALESYISHKEPGFAVLVAGPWGVGKTHLIKAFAEKPKRGELPLIVSLFGVTSTDDIDSAIFAASLPMLGGNFAKAAGRFTKTMLKFAPQQFGDLGAKDFLKLKLPPVLIFDDLERTNLEPKEILGAINGFVEQDRKHVILLANEEKLFDGETSGEKEKVIGQTLTVVADIEAALGPMLEKLGEDAKAFLTANREMVISVFNTADYGNLRSLAQVLWDFGRLYNALTPALQDKTEGMVELLKVFVALGLEVKKGVLGRGELKMREAVFLKLNHPNHTPKTQESIKRLSELDEKYKGWELSNGRSPCVLPTALAVEILIDGKIGAESQVTTISQTPLFLDKEKEKEWQTVFWASQREPDVVNKAFASMQAKLKALEYTEPGVILHVLAVWLRAPKMGLVGDSVNVIEEECRAYIDAAAKSGDLPAGNGTSSGYGFERHSYNGLGYPHSDEPRGKSFQLLYDQMKTTQDRLFRDTFPDICKEILNLMQTDVQQFNTLLCGDSSSVNLYHRLPVLAEMEIENFIAQLANLSAEDQVTVYQTLKQRYDMWWEELLPEKPWLCDLVKAMEARAKTLSGVAAWQTRFNLQAYLNPIIDALEA